MDLISSIDDTARDDPAELYVGGLETLNPTAVERILASQIIQLAEAIAELTQAVEELKRGRG